MTQSRRQEVFVVPSQPLRNGSQVFNISRDAQVLFCSASHIDVFVLEASPFESACSGGSIARFAIPIQCEADFTDDVFVDHSPTIYKNSQTRVLNASCYHCHSAERFMSAKFSPVIGHRGCLISVTTTFGYLQLFRQETPRRADSWLLFGEIRPLEEPPTGVLGRLSKLDPDWLLSQGIPPPHKIPLKERPFVFSQQRYNDSSWTPFTDGRSNLCLVTCDGEMHIQRFYPNAFSSVAYFHDVHEPVLMIEFDPNLGPDGVMFLAVATRTRMMVLSCRQEKPSRRSCGLRVESTVAECQTFQRVCSSLRWSESHKLVAGVSSRVHLWEGGGFRYITLGLVAMISDVVWRGDGYVQATTADGNYFVFNTTTSTQERDSHILRRPQMQDNTSISAFEKGEDEDEEDEANADPDDDNNGNQAEKLERNAGDSNLRRREWQAFGQIVSFNGLVGLTAFSAGLACNVYVDITPYDVLGPHIIAICSTLLSSRYLQGLAQFYLWDVLYLLNIEGKNHKGQFQLTSEASQIIQELQAIEGEDVRLKWYFYLSSRLSILKGLLHPNIYQHSAAAASVELLISSPCSQASGTAKDLCPVCRSVVDNLGHCQNGHKWPLSWISGRIIPDPFASLQCSARCGLRILREERSEDSRCYKCDGFFPPDSATMPWAQELAQPCSPPVVEHGIDTMGYDSYDEGEYLEQSF